MLSFGRVVAAFLFMMVLGYLAIVVLVPAPTSASWRPDDSGGVDAAMRLTAQAKALVSKKVQTVLE